MNSLKDNNGLVTLSSDAPITRIRLLLYAAVPDASMLQQGFYAAELDGLLSQPGVAEVRSTNKLKDVWSNDYDGLISYFYSHTALASLIARLRRKKVIATGGGEQVFRFMSSSASLYIVRIILFSLSLLFSNYILATSTSDFLKMRSIGFFRRSAIKLSFHGAPAVDKLDRADFARQRPKGSMLTICGMDTYANIKRKGLFRAIDLLSKIRKHDPAACLTIIGRTTCSCFVRKYALEKSCEDALVFAGYVSENDKLELLRSNRYYIQLSDYEGFGIGALEAMAMGCQVVHSNVGGLRDTVADFGIKLAPDDPIELDIEGPYEIADWEKFTNHMSQFSVSKRASDILVALGLK
jgi:glycosyltransferase involved in cell wall biosynthesis